MFVARELFFLVLLAGIKSWVSGQLSTYVRGYLLQFVNGCEGLMRTQTLA